jgi:predicted amidohydrolase
MPFDLLIKGGEVVDPGANQRGRLDVGIVGDRIAAVDRDLPASDAGEVVDASGQIVTPGLVDLHTHVYWGVTYWGVEADPVAARTGVTIWLDVGSSGSYSLPGFRRWIAEPSQSRTIHQMSVQGPMFDLPNTLAKFLALGMSLPDVIERATVRPARAMNRPELGTLEVGAPADVALFRLREGSFTYYDVAMKPRSGKVQLDNTLTIVAGKKLERTEERPLHTWASIPEAQRSAGPRP